MYEAENEVCFMDWDVEEDWQQKTVKRRGEKSGNQVLLADGFLWLETTEESVTQKMHDILQEMRSKGIDSTLQQTQKLSTYFCFWINTRILPRPIVEIRLAKK